MVHAYKLTTLLDNERSMYLPIKKGMYWLKHTGIIANQELVKHMDPFGYHPVKHKPVMWIHDNPKNICSLVVNNFCVLYYSVEYADHFFNELKAKYLITIHTGEKFYIEINLDWDHVNRTIILSMRNHVRKALHIFQHTLMGGKEYSPHIFTPI